MQALLVALAALALVPTSGAASGGSNYGGGGGGYTQLPACGPLTWGARHILFQGIYWSCLAPRDHWTIDP